MKRALLLSLAAAALLAGAAGLLRLRRGMDSAEVMRKLSGLRLALELYRQEKKAPPASFADTVASGHLEAAPELKLRWHFARTGVRDTPSLRITDSGGWAYVSDPGDRDFGLVYIDCSHRDEKGRFWSEF